MADQAAQDMALVTLDWTGLNQFGFSDDDVNIFERAQTAFFQPLFSFAQPDAQNLRRHLRPIDSNSPALRLIVHGVFPRTSRATQTTHLMTPLFHSLEMLFA